MRRLAARRTVGATLAICVAIGAAYAGAVANLTIWPVAGHAPRNIVPFRTITGYLATGHLHETSVRNLLGNLVMLAPLGALLATATRCKPWMAALAVPLTSAGIESWQFLGATGRSVDIDDVILNTIGGLIGYLGGLTILRILEAVAPWTLDRTRPHLEPPRRSAPTGGAGRPSDGSSASDGAAIC
jgi:glycopeptide antibiotics resistance protein